MLTPEFGTVVGERYRILRPLGEGGMGTVYEAENLLTLKRAAIKLLHPRLMAVEDAGKRLLYEARATSRIRHHNVVDVYDVLLEHNSVFLVMELLLGESLSTYLEHNQLQFHQLVKLLLPAMRGVEAAHAVGVVHRDIKPENIFLAREAGHPEPVPKVIDFGISRVFSASDEGRLTRSGMTMGTPRYVSYEQLRGARDVDVRADVYAFGVILYEGLVGRSPYEATTLSEQAIQFATTEPPAPHEVRPEVPETLSRLVLAALEKERDRRTPSMSELIRQLEPFADAAAYAAPLPALGPAPERPSRTLSGPHPSTASTEGITPVVLQVAQLAASLPSPKRKRHAMRWLTVSLAGVVCGLTGWTLLRPPAQPPAQAASARGTSAAAAVAPAAPLLLQANATEAAEPAASPALAREPERGVESPQPPELRADAAVTPKKARAARARSETTLSAPPAAEPADAAAKPERPLPAGDPLRAGGMSKDQF